MEACHPGTALLSITCQGGMVVWVHSLDSSVPFPSAWMRFTASSIEAYVSEQRSQLISALTLRSLGEERSTITHYLFGRLCLITPIGLTALVRETLLVVGGR